MIGKYVIRAVGVLTCMTAVVAGWDAEAGWRRHHHRGAACCEPVCCEPVYVSACCEPVRETVCCEPVRETVCCETVIVAPAATCCSTSVVVAEKALPTGQASVMKTESSQQATAGRGTKTTPASLKR